MGMTNGDRQRIGGIVGLWNLLQPQDLRNHRHDLLFLGFSVTGNRRLDLHRRIFRDLQTLLDLLMQLKK